MSARHTPTPDPRRVRVDLGPRSYDVVIGPALLPTLGPRVIDALGPRRAARLHLVSDDNVATHADLAAAAVSPVSAAVSRTVLRATESTKSLASVEQILLDLTAARHERWDPLVALGGGIVGDVAGFAAAIYRRGVPFIQCPTTLLAMVDASVGGKTGVNLHASGSLKKNLVGAFWQPALVLADTDTLTTLPPREFAAGIAECLKHALLASGAVDQGLLIWTRSHARAILDLDAPTLVELIARNVAIKARVVGRDEREEDPAGDGGRALLNLGHTYAHAIETLPGLTLDTRATSPILHGEAVALGLLAAAHAAVALGLGPTELAAAVRRDLVAFGLPTSATGLPPDDALLDAMMHDKKVSGGKLRLILPLAAGGARVVDDPPRAAVIEGWRAIRV